MKALPRLSRAIAVGAVAFAVGSAGVVTTAATANAVLGCRVAYRVASQWGGGFTAEVSATNLGDPVTAWQVGFDFAGGQKVTQAWNATVTQSGTRVQASNVSYNGSLATGGSASFGFLGSSGTTNPVPTTFTLNGTTCTGDVTVTPGPTIPVPTSSTAAPTTAPPTSAPPTTVPPTTAVPTTVPATTVPPATTPPTTSGWNPPSNLVAPLAQVWTHEESTYSDLYGFKNYGWDQVFANKGSLNYCVRWDSTAHVTAAQRDGIEAALKRQVKKWTDLMIGHNGWPYTDVPVKVVGWAVRDRAQLEWTDTSVDIYVNNIREDAPQCAETCGRFFNQTGSYPNCPGGITHHYDESLWLTAGFSGGAGGDWGQRVGSEYFLSALNTENIHIFLHEMGHTFGLDDFYDWTPDGVGGFLMDAGTATQITAFDEWMFKDWWRHLKSRYGL